MFFKKRMTDDLEFRVFTSRTDEARVNEHHFRKNAQFAGQFTAWQSILEMLLDPLVSNEFFSELRDCWTSKELGSDSIEIDYGKVVGWSNTDQLANYAADDLEPFKPNRQSSGLRVKVDRVNLRAPQTSLVTIVYSLVSQDRGYPYPKRCPVVNIFTCYPGPDIGHVRRDMTNKQGIVFFDWNHPGA